MNICLQKNITVSDWYASAILKRKNIPSICLQLTAADMRPLIKLFILLSEVYL